MARDELVARKVVALTGTRRFAPSPTSDLHLGNLRTALLVWLFARSTGVRPHPAGGESAPGQADAAVSLADLGQAGMTGQQVLGQPAESLGPAEPGESITPARLLPRLDPARLPREPWVVEPQAL